MRGAAFKATKHMLHQRIIFTAKKKELASTSAAISVIGLVCKFSGDNRLAEGRSDILHSTNNQTLYANTGAQFKRWSMLELQK